MGTILRKNRNITMPEAPIELIYELDDPIAPNWISLVLGVPLRHSQHPSWRNLVVELIQRLGGSAPLGLLLIQVVPERNWYGDEIVAAGGQVLVCSEPTNQKLVRLAGYLPATKASSGLLRDFLLDEIAEMGLLYINLLSESDGPIQYFRIATETERFPPLCQGLLHLEGDGGILEINLPGEKDFLPIVTELGLKYGFQLRTLQGRDWPL
ncbi:hypothetical protein SAMN02745885_02776 [Carboxydocella sporoproducens DSM 16521]|uniref:Uncharacterized protein n=2 Tax=Carboxydocella TaxID=178898 RepID=A0A1T4SNA8_9FIRM|nr:MULTISPECIES: hypothetical protein [Carboxydocella]AVX21506.1 hypothetical protein CFE_2363 [Carboxydocella thermautotrophica]GAW28168.1 hypothetical protein ULO1_07380 [Carboxydocella sp. ULO1]SKA29653.1 hypothetical protein SAMN02745885_02776 [Carboxydocella sporoproducens DSM 16521]